MSLHIILAKEWHKVANSEDMDSQIKFCNLICNYCTGKGLTEIALLGTVNLLFVCFPDEYVW